MVKFDNADADAVIISLSQALWVLVNAVEEYYDPGCECVVERELLGAVNDYLLAR